MIQTYEILLNKKYTGYTYIEDIQSDTLKINNEYYYNNKNNKNLLVDSFTVRSFLTNDKNKKIVSLYYSFLSSSTIMNSSLINDPQSLLFTPTAEFKNIFYDDEKLADSFNNFYNTSILNGIDYNSQNVFNNSIKNELLPNKKYNLVLQDIFNNYFFWNNDANSIPKLPLENSVLDIYGGKRDLQQESVMVESPFDKENYYIDIILNKNFSQLSTMSFEICDDIIFKHIDTPTSFSQNNSSKIKFDDFIKLNSVITKKSFDNSEINEFNKIKEYELPNKKTNYTGSSLIQCFVNPNFKNNENEYWKNDNNIVNFENVSYLLPQNSTIPIKILLNNVAQQNLSVEVKLNDFSINNDVYVLPPYSSLITNGFSTIHFDVGDIEKTIFLKNNFKKAKSYIEKNNFKNYENFQYDEEFINNIALNIINTKNFLISGSFALSKQGTIYRNSLNDLDVYSIDDGIYEKLEVKDETKLYNIDKNYCHKKVNAILNLLDNYSIYKISKLKIPNEWLISDNPLDLSTVVYKIYIKNKRKNNTESIFCIDLYLKTEYVFNNINVLENTYLVNSKSLLDVKKNSERKRDKDVFDVNNFKEYDIIKDIKSNSFIYVNYTDYSSDNIISVSDKNSIPTINQIINYDNFLETKDYCQICDIVLNKVLNLKLGGSFALSKQGILFRSFIKDVDFYFFNDNKNDVFLNEKNIIIENFSLNDTPIKLIQLINVLEQDCKLTIKKIKKSTRSGDVDFSFSIITEKIIIELFFTNIDYQSNKYNYKLVNYDYILKDKTLRSSKQDLFDIQQFKLYKTPFDINNNSIIFSDSEYANKMLKHNEKDIILKSTNESSHSSSSSSSQTEVTLENKVFNIYLSNTIGNLLIGSKQNAKITVFKN